MNDKILTMALMLTLIMIGVNSFLIMASTNLYDEQGNQLKIYYGLDSSNDSWQTNTENTNIDTDLTISSTVPSQTQGINAVSVNDDPIGINYTNILQKLGIGVQLVLLKLSDLFPIISPITTGIAMLSFAIQGFAIAYLGSILIRGILGRIT